MKNKIREIIEKYAPIDSYLAIHGFKANQCKIIHYEDFDKLEKDLQTLMTKAVNRAFKNAEKKLYAKANREGEHTE